MTGYDAYCEYINLKNHFTRDSYDYFKYNGKSRLKPDSFHKRKDKLWFEKLAKHNDVHGFLVANFINDKKAFIRDIAYSENAEQTYKAWLKRQQSLSYIFKNETEENLCVPFNFNFVCKDGEHPYLLRTHLSGKICLETLCILLELTKSKPYWDKKMEYDIFWNEFSLLVSKYTPFIKYDKEKFRKIVLDLYDD